jgi:hypothetical protein
MAVEPRDDQPEDPWKAARAAARDDVVSVLAPRSRVCPECGADQRGAGRHCPECGADLTVRFARWRSLRKYVFAGAAVLVVAGITAALIVPDTRESAAGERTRATKRQSALEQRERARLTRDARPVRADAPPLPAGTDPVEHRAAVVRRGEQLITADARKRVKAGKLDGPIKGAACTPYPNVEERKAAEQDPATVKARYDCTAYKQTFEARSVNGEKRTGYFGYPYWLVVDYPASKLVFCKITPRAGEGGRSLAFVPVPVPCRDPEGPG